MKARFVVGTVCLVIGGLSFVAQREQLWSHLSRSLLHPSQSYRIVDVSGRRIRSLFEGVRASPVVSESLRLTSQLPKWHACGAPIPKDEGPIRRAMRTVSATSVNASNCVFSGCAGTRVALDDMDCFGGQQCPGSGWSSPYSNGNYPPEDGWQYNGLTDCNGCLCQIQTCNNTE